MHRAVKTDGRTAIAAATRGPRRYTSEFVPGGHSVTKTVRVSVTGNIMQITNKFEVGPITRSQAVARIADRTAKNCKGHVT